MTTDKTQVPVLWLAPGSRTAELLAEEFVLHEGAPKGPFAGCILAHGGRASQALEVALASPGAVAAVVLLSPPAVETLDKDLLGRLGAVEAPVLTLFGTEDAAAPPELGHAWRRAVPKGFQTFVFGAGADMANERPEALAAIIADFFRRGDGFVVKAVEDRLYA